MREEQNPDAFGQTMAHEMYEWLQEGWFLSWWDLLPLKKEQGIVTEIFPTQEIGEH